MKCLLSVVVSLLVLLPGHASAQPWPGKQPIKVVVAFTPGSATDTVGRLVFDQVGKQLGQTIIVENRGGAGGSLGAAQVAKAEPDGYTLLVTSSGYTIAPATYSKLSYDPLKDLTAIAALANTPNVLITAPAKGYRTVADLVKAAQNKPGALNYASAGTGSASHLPAERFRLSAGFEAVHIPYKGAPEAIREVMAERVDFYFAPLPAARSIIQQGGLRALAVSSSERSSALPDVPTTLEAGYKDSDYNFWVGAFVTGGTPRDIVDRLHQETAKALQTPLIQQRLKALGADLMPLNQQQFSSLIEQEIQSNKRLVKAVGIKPI